MPQDTIDYPGLIDAAMRGVVRDVLKQVKLYGLPGDHHFFISFRTDAAGVKISEGLRNRYPQEITIVLQHQFWDLKVEESHFSIMLSFNNVPEKLSVPFEALTAFADPSVKFGLQFNADWAGDQNNEPLKQPTLPGLPAQSLSAPPAVQAMSFEDADDADSAAGSSGAEIIALDAFRKK